MIFLFWWHVFLCLNLYLPSVSSGNGIALSLHSHHYRERGWRRRSEGGKERRSGAEEWGDCFQPAVVFREGELLGEIGCDRVRANTASHPRAVSPRSACSLSTHVRLRLLTSALLEATKYLTHWRIGNPLRVCTLFNLSPLLFIEYIYGAERVAQRVAWFDSASLHPWGGGHPNSAPWVLKEACATQRCVPLFIIERNTLVECQRGVFFVIEVVRC